MRRGPALQYIDPAMIQASNLQGRNHPIKLLPRRGEAEIITCCQVRVLSSPALLHVPKSFVPLCNAAGSSSCKAGGQNPGTAHIVVLMVNPKSASSTNLKQVVQLATKPEHCGLNLKDLSRVTLTASRR
jgi:hypothetical protein